jgi:hypothetical protein
VHASLSSHSPVLSQQLAVRGTEAGSGNAEAFNSFRVTKDSIESDVAHLQSGYGDDSRAGSAVQKVADTWSKIKPSADQLVSSEQAIVAIAGHADKFIKDLPNFQATLDELVISEVEVLKLSGTHELVPGLNRQYQVNPLHLYSERRPKPFVEPVNGKPERRPLTQYYLRIRTKGGVEGIYGAIDKEAQRRAERLEIRHPDACVADGIDEVICHHAATNRGGPVVGPTVGVL